MIIRREPSAPNAMLAAAAERGWTQVGPPTLKGLQPPALALVDVEDLGRSRPTPCEYWAAESPDGLLATHVSIFHDEYDTASYDMVSWTDPSTELPLPHVELSFRGHSREHHRLGDRWGAHGSHRVPVSIPDWTMSARRDCAPAALAALASHDGLDAIARIVGEERGGVRLDAVGGRCAIWQLTAGPRKGAQRWRNLIEAALVARSVLIDAAAVR